MKSELNEELRKLTSIEKQYRGLIKQNKVTENWKNAAYCEGVVKGIGYAKDSIKFLLSALTFYENANKTTRVNKIVSSYKRKITEKLYKVREKNV